MHRNLARNWIKNSDLIRGTLKKDDIELIIFKVIVISFNISYSKGWRLGYEFSLTVAAATTPCSGAEFATKLAVAKQILDDRQIRTIGLISIACAAVELKWTAAKLGYGRGTVSTAFNAGTHKGRSGQCLSGRQVHHSCRSLAALTPTGDYGGLASPGCFVRGTVRVLKELVEGRLGGLNSHIRLGWTARGCLFFPFHWRCHCKYWKRLAVWPGCRCRPDDWCQRA